MSAEALTYTIDPHGLALWLPASLAQRLGIERGVRLSSEQWNGREIQELLEERREAGGGRTFMSDQPTAKGMRLA